MDASRWMKLEIVLNDLGSQKGANNVGIKLYEVFVVVNDRKKELWFIRGWGRGR